MVDYYSYRTKQYGALCTIIVHAIIFIILLLQFKTPIPPYPDGGGGSGNGIELNLGFSDVGSGSTPLEMPTIAEVAKPVAVAEPKPDKGKLVTQDMEDVPKIKEQDLAEPKKIKKETKKMVAETPVKTVKKETPKEPVLNQHALYKGSKTSAEGTDKTPGDKGDPNGTLGAKAFGGKNGSGGTGGGTGGGDGTGKGNGIGPGMGIFANLKDRTPMSLPKPEYKHQVEGTVVVDVVVDKEGKVTQATSGAKGSNTADESLWEAAKQAALQARFDKKSDAATFQKGTITYRFRLQ
jgi:TonB family protein